MQPSRQETLGRLLRAVDARSGIVRTVELPRLDAGDPPVRIAESHPARLVGDGEVAGVNEGGGAALDRDLAIIKAVGESLERYCAAFPQRPLRRASWRELGADAVPPEAFALFSEDQYRGPGFPFQRFDRETVVPWVQGRGLGDGQPRWVPAPFVHLPHRRAAREPRITTSISTGLAAGSDPSAATSSALLEVVERDAFMLAWRHQMATPRVDLDSLGHGQEAMLVAALRSSGMKCQARLMTQDIPLPVIVVVLRGQAPAHPVAVIGAGAAAHPRRALRLALEEACLSLFGINRLRRRLGEEIAGLPDEELRSLALQSTAFAIRPDLAAAAPCLFEDGPKAEITTLAKLEERFEAVADGSLESLVAVLGDFSRNAVMVDCTTPDVGDLGVSVTRVVIPELRPLDHDAGAPHLGGRRWLGRSFHLGPHPFP
jgi:ribosomal protein S12 methylthiotransferase accessory factor